jgi:hypothetical protein
MAAHLLSAAPAAAAQHDSALETALHFLSVFISMLASQPTMPPTMIVTIQYIASSFDERAAECRRESLQRAPAGAQDDSSSFSRRECSAGGARICFDIVSGILE